MLVTLLPFTGLQYVCKFLTELKSSKYRIERASKNTCGQIFFSIRFQARGLAIRNVNKRWYRFVCRLSLLQAPHKMNCWGTSPQIWCTVFGSDLTRFGGFRRSSYSGQLLQGTVQGTLKDDDDRDACVWSLGLVEVWFFFLGHLVCTVL